MSGKHSIFGKIAEGLEHLKVINDAYVDEKNRPYINMRIYHTIVLDDPFDDPERLPIPEGSPEPIMKVCYTKEL